MKKQIIFTILCALMCSCSGFLDPLPNGSYNENNHEDYPKLVRGYVEKAYALRPSSYVSTDYIGCDGLADNMTWSSHSNANYRLATGSPSMADYSFEPIYKRDYQAIYYCNLFLKDNIGLNTRYLLDEDANRKLQRSLHGDALALRAWYLYDLLKFFGGRSTDGQMLGVPIFQEPVDPYSADMSKVYRATYEECVNQIIEDCNLAMKYLPLGNREFFQDQDLTIPVDGEVRYRKMDRASVMALKASVLLTWASPAFNPFDEMSRWEAAAQAAKDAIDHKLERESVSAGISGGFDPAAAFIWKNPNDAEAYYVSDISSSSEYEKAFYPKGFGGTAKFVPTQDLVDAFPMADGYPVGQSPKYIYDEKKPYENRDPRFYATIFHDRSKLKRNTNITDIMYTFDTAEGGNDAPGRGDTSPTGYYIKKHVFTGWNSTDYNVQEAQSCIFFYRWTHMLLTFAEAVNQIGGPFHDFDGMTPKDALAYIRSRKMEDGTNGLGVVEDPYLDKVALDGPDEFEKLIKNEWRIETCFEGHRFHNLRRWKDEYNVDIHKVKIVRNLDGRVESCTSEKLEQRRYPSPWLPIPYMEIRRSPLMAQNEGWESWN